MPVFKSGQIVLTDDKEVYRQGEVVSGTVSLDVNEDVVVKGIRVYLVGETLVKWDEYAPGKFGGTKDFISTEKYFWEVMTVFGKRLSESGPNVTLPAGQHQYSFQFRLSTDVGFPSSYEGEYGAIRFWLKLEVHRPFPHFNKNWYCGITVIDNIDVNASRYKDRVRSARKKQVSKALGFGDAGTLTLTSSIDRGAYCAGEKIALSVVVKNESTKDLGKLKAQICQEVVYTANNETKRVDTGIMTLVDSSVKKGEERVWKNQLLKIDAIPPSTKPGSCHILVVSYCVKVIVEVPMGFNLVCNLPITVGTIPYGHSLQTLRGAVTAAQDVGSSSAVTYIKCNQGFETFTKSEDDFIDLSYIPMCVYVPKYIFPPPKPRTPAHTHDQENVPRLNIPAGSKAVSVKKSDKPYGILLIRFPDTHIEEFRKTMREESQNLAECEGEIIACASKTIGQPGQWPEKMSVAVLKFASVKAASDWFIKTQNVVNPPWLIACDAMVGTIREQFKEGNLAFSLEKTKIKRGATQVKIALFQDSFVKVIRPLRLKKTGVILVNGKQYTTLHGQWLEVGYSMSVTQWESLDNVTEFEQEKQQGQYKDVNDLTLDIFEVIPVVMFQSEDLSPFETLHASESPVIESQAEGDDADHCKETEESSRAMGTEQTEQHQPTAEFPCQAANSEPPGQSKETAILSDAKASEQTEQPETEVPNQTAESGHPIKFDEQVKESGVSPDVMAAKQTEQHKKTEVPCAATNSGYHRQNKVIEQHKRNDGATVRTALVVEQPEEAETSL